MGFKLAANAEFDWPVKITRADGEDPVLSVRWRHKDSDALKEWIQQIDARPAAESLEEVIVSWKADGAYSRDALDRLLKAFVPAGGEMLRGYLDALTKAREKN